MLPHLIWFLIFFLFIYLCTFFFIVPSFFVSLKTRFLFFLYNIQNACRFSGVYTFFVKFFYKSELFSFISVVALSLKRIILASYIYNYLYVKIYIERA